MIGSASAHRSLEFPTTDAQWNALTDEQAETLARAHLPLTAVKWLRLSELRKESVDAILATAHPLTHWKSMDKPNRDAVSRLIRHDVRDIALTAASHLPTMPVDQFLSDNVNWSSAVARNPHIDVDVMVRAITHEAVEVRLAVLSNPEFSVSLSTLDIANQPFEVRKAVWERFCVQMSHPVLTALLSVEFAGDPSDGSRP